MRIIGHLDMDAFFAAVEERDKPRIKGLPIVVGSDPAEGRGRGVVSTANYKAREYGIHSTLPISTAWKLSEKAKKEGKPEAVFLPVDFEKYGEVSERIIEIIKKYSPAVEQASIDEAYLDLSDLPAFKKVEGGFYDYAKEIAQKIKDEIYKKEKLTCSVGIGPNKLIAKIASGFKKPNGMTVVGSDNETACAELVEAFLEPLKIRDIPGIGPKSEIILNKFKIKTIKDLKNLTKKQLEEMFGKWGGEIYDKARGKDDSPLVLEWEAKSIGEQETFLEDSLDANKVTKKIKQLCQQVFSRFRESDFENFRNITVTVRFSDFTTKSRSHTLKEATGDLKVLEFEVLKLLFPFLDKRENPKHKAIRLLGVRIEKFS